MLISLPILVRAGAAALAAAACSAAPSPATGDSLPPPASRAESTSMARAPEQSSFTRIVTQRNSGFDEPTELVIRDQAALESAWRTLFNQVVGNAPPKVDFARETVILVALGSRSSGGHAVHVDAVARSGEGAVVRYTATRPGEGCMSTQALTSPVDVVRAPRIAGRVRFQRHEVVQAC